MQPKFCQSLIKKFEADQRQRPWVAGQGIDKKRKDSSGITLDQYPDWHADVQKIHDITLKGLMQYARNYPHLVIGAVALKWTPPGESASRSIAAEDIKDMGGGRTARLCTV